MERYKSANELYRESGSKLPFKEWLTREKEAGTFIFNKKLNTKIYDMQNQKIFRSADGTTSTAAATKAPTVKFSSRDKRMVIVGAVTAMTAFFIFKAVFHAR